MRTDANERQKENAGRFSIGRIIFLALILMMALLIGTAAMLLQSYRSTIRQEETNLHNVATAFASQTLMATRAIDAVMLSLQHDYLHHPSKPGEQRMLSFRLDPLLAGQTKNNYLVSADILGLNGDVIASTGARTQDRSTFDQIELRMRTAAVNAYPLDVHPVDVHPVTGQGTLVFSRTLQNAAGKPAGLITVSVDSRYFQDFYNAVALGNGGSVTLMHRDGTMLVRGPGFPDLIGHSFRKTPLFERYLPVATHGAFEETSPIDGTRRFYGYDIVHGYPFVIITGTDKSHALSFWRERLYTALAFLGLTAMMLVVLVREIARSAGKQDALIDYLEASERRLNKSADYLRKMLDSISSPIWVVDKKKRLVLFNEAFCKFAGRKHDDLVGHHASSLPDKQSSPDKLAMDDLIFSGLTGAELETNVRDSAGDRRTFIKQVSRLLDENGELQFVNVLTDITERKQAEVRLAYLAEYDALTGLPNLNLFRRVLNDRVLAAGRNNERLCVALICLQRCQEISDIMGHGAGEEAIAKAGEMLCAELFNACYISRVKNNEFALLLKADEVRGGGDGLERFIRDVVAGLSQPTMIRGQEFFLGPTVGLASFPDDAKSGDELLRLAEVAKNRAAAESGEPVHFYSEASHTVLAERLTIERQLRRALERKEFRVVFQPKVDIRSGQIIGFEALLRWSNPALGEVSPSRFIPVAEQTGLIIPIGEWVLNESCRHAASWTEQFGRTVKVAVNLSPRQFHQKELMSMIRRSYEAFGASPEMLELEVTESVIMSREQEVDSLMHAIRALGVALSINDFGTGYSSLAYLKRFPVQSLKIDRSFVRDLGVDEDSTAIVESIINLGHGLRLRVIAEGVETVQQLQYLEELRCDEYQGFLFSRPVEASEVPLLISDSWIGDAERD